MRKVLDFVKANKKIIIVVILIIILVGTIYFINKYTDSKSTSAASSIPSPFVSRSMDGRIFTSVISRGVIAL